MDILPVIRLAFFNEGGNGGHTFCADGPDNWSPCHGEPSDEQTGENNHRLSCMWRVLRGHSVECKVSHRCKNHEAYKHPCSTIYEGLSAAEVFNDIQTYESGSYIDTSQNHLCNVRIVNPRALEYDSPVVKEVISSSKLLQSLQRNAKSESISHSRRHENFIPLLVLVEHIFVVFCFDFSKLFCHDPVIRGDSIKLDHSVLRALDFAVSVVITRALGEEHDSNTKDQNPEEGDAERNTPRCRVCTLFRTEVNAVCNEYAESDEELVSTVWELD